MAFDPNNFLVIGGGNPYRPNDVFIHERENVDGKPGKIVTMGDARGDVNEIAQEYIEEGFDPKKIIINGQPASDVFQAKEKSGANINPVVAMNPWQAMLYQSIAAKSGDKNASDNSGFMNTGIQPMVVMNPWQAMLLSGGFKNLFNGQKQN